MSQAEARVRFAALMVTALKLWGPLSAEVDDLWDWGLEYLGMDGDALDELLNQEDQVDA